jgi:hypothetical protein
MPAHRANKFASKCIVPRIGLFAEFTLEYHKISLGIRHSNSFRGVERKLSMNVIGFEGELGGAIQSKKMCSLRYNPAPWIMIISECRRKIRVSNRLRRENSIKV